MNRRSGRPSPTRGRPVRADGGHDAAASRVLVLNPVSGSADHAERVRELATDHDFAVRETHEGGDAIDFGREAADADLVAAAGGDGTIHEVVRGLYEADALDSTTVGVVPAGTGNNFAGNIGVEGIEEAFSVLETGETRQVDLGIANGRPFVNSTIAGLTANASSETTAEMKDSFGVLAYVVNTIRTAADFEGLSLDVETAADEQSWRGEAAFVLVGNGRRFPVEGQTQAHMEDGRFEVTIIEDRPTGKLVGEATLRRLLGTDTSNITRLETSELSISIRNGEPGTFSLDGEMLSARDLGIETERGGLSLRVGEGYEIDPQPPE
jgi:YegS/Rv2252/BmrU family lipid kinase